MKKKICIKFRNHLLRIPSTCISRLIFSPSVFDRPTVYVQIRETVFPVKEALPASAIYIIENFNKMSARASE